MVRVHRELLALEAAPLREDLWTERFDDINAFERHLTRSGTVVLKFFLHLSKDEQRKRLLERLDDPDKNWKFSANDVRERRSWDRYQVAYEKMLNATTTNWAPWYVVPSDHKWFMRTAIAGIIVDKLTELRLTYPRADEAANRMLDDLRAELQSSTGKC